MLEHWDKILEGGGVLFFVVAAFVAATPRKDDDRALLGFLRTPLARRLATTGALATAGALAAALLGGCGGRAAVAIEGPRASACIAAETGCVDRAEAGTMTTLEARACVYGARLACDMLRDRVLGTSQEEGANGSE
jgi:hypothetical protein